MNPATAQALEQSIEKWKARAAGELSDASSTDCPLCHLFHSIYNPGNSCRGCPVYISTGEVNCGCTPFENYATAYSRNRKIEAAKREVEFLEALRESN